MEQYYNTIETPASTEFKDRGSTFVSYAFQVITPDDFKKRLNEIKKEHPKATHHCFAYRIGNEGNIFRASDAGEPSGSAGKQILGQIDSRRLTNTLVIVVRYFGGTLLGVPGLINAYKSASALVLQLTPVIQKPVEKLHKLQFDYTQINEVMMIAKQFNCAIIEKDLQLFCTVTLGIPVSTEEEVLHRLRDMRGVNIDN